MVTKMVTKVLQLTLIRENETRENAAKPEKFTAYVIPANARRTKHEWRKPPASQEWRNNPFMAVFAFFAPCFAPEKRWNESFLSLFSFLRKG